MQLEQGSATLRLQATYENAFSEFDRDAQRQQSDAKVAEDRMLRWISSFTAKFNQDFDTLAILYKKIYQFLLLRCTSPNGTSTPPKDQSVEREVAAALESVFPRVGLRSYVALTGPEKGAQLQELASIVLGIRLFNQHQRKGGAGLPVVNTIATNLRSDELLQNVQKEVTELNDLCKLYADAIVAAAKPPKGGPWDKLPSPAEVERVRSDLLYHRQYLCYLINLQEDLASTIERLAKDQKNFAEELIDLDALVGGRVSVPKEQVYPRFDALARVYHTAWTEVKALEARTKLHGLLTDLRKQYFPQLPEASKELLDRSERRDSAALDDDEEDPVDLDTIQGPSPGVQDDPGAGGIRLTVENTPEFLQLPLDFQGFCIHTLVTQNRLLVPGNPALGVARYAGRYCVFATERGFAEFCSDPDKFFAGIREICTTHPELIHLLRIQEDFPKSSLQAMIQVSSGGQADVSTDTPMHFQETNIDKGYEWNEWKLRREAVHLADIRRKTTSATQTALSHLRRENETQVFLPKEVGTNTTVSRGTNPPRWRKYYVGLRGEPQEMQVSEVNFDL